MMVRVEVEVTEQDDHLFPSFGRVRVEGGRNSNHLQFLSILLRAISPSTIGHTLLP